MSRSDERLLEAQRHEDEQARRQHQMLAVDCWTRSGVDPLHARRKPEELATHAKWTNALRAASEVVNGGGLLGLIGDRGNGKTQLAVELIRLACREGRACLYLRSREVGMLLREAYDNRPDAITEREALAKLVEPWLLVVDECQEQPDKEWERQSFTLAVDKRYGASRPTVLIANCVEKHFKQLMGASIVDRMREGGGILVFDWPSFRGRHDSMR